MQETDDDVQNSYSPFDDRNHVETDDDDYTTDDYGKEFWRKEHHHHLPEVGNRNITNDNISNYLILLLFLVSFFVILIFVISLIKIMKSRNGYEQLVELPQLYSNSIKISV